MSIKLSFNPANTGDNTTIINEIENNIQNNLQTIVQQNLPALIGALTSFAPYMTVAQFTEKYGSLDILSTTGIRTPKEVQSFSTTFNSTQGPFSNYATSAYRFIYLRPESWSYNKIQIAISERTLEINVRTDTSSSVNSINWSTWHSVKLNDLASHTTLLAKCPIPSVENGNPIGFFNIRKPSPVYDWWKLPNGTWAWISFTLVGGEITTVNKGISSGNAGFDGHNTTYMYVRIA
jgi:hypothetical protein